MSHFSVKKTDLNFVLFLMQGLFNIFCTSHIENYTKCKKAVDYCHVFVCLDLIFSDKFSILL